MLMVLKEVCVLAAGMAVAVTLIAGILLPVQMLVEGEAV